MHPLLNTRKSKNKHSSRDAVHKPYSKVQLTKKKHTQLYKLYDRTLYAPYMHISKINHRKKQHIPKWLACGTLSSQQKTIQTLRWIFISQLLKPGDKNVKPQYQKKRTTSRHWAGKSGRRKWKREKFNAFAVEIELRSSWSVVRASTYRKEKKKRQRRENTHVRVFNGTRAHHQTEEVELGPHHSASPPIHYLSAAAATSICYVLSISPVKISFPCSWTSLPFPFLP